MTSRTSGMAACGVMLIVLVLGWWVWSTKPNQVDIESAAKVIPPLPTVNLAQLESQQLESRTINGALPISVDTEQLGREDPFAGI